MLTSELESPALVRRSPRSVVWIVLVASAGAFLLTGLTTTAIVLSRVAVLPASINTSFWMWFPLAGGLTLASLGLRTLRWIFLLRRAETRIPIRDACIAYLA